MLRVSKAICKETVPILYSINSFALLDTKGLLYFLTQIGESRAWLEDITIVESHRHKYAYAAYTLLAQCTRLRCFAIDSYDGDFYECHTVKDLAEEFFKDARPWLEGFGFARKQKFAALEILDFGEGVVPNVSFDNYEICDDQEEQKKFFAYLKKLLAKHSRLLDLVP